MMSGHTIFHHPQLGALKGDLLGGRLQQFLGIPYAYIPQRFAPANPVTALPREPVFDATKLPPASVQPLDSAKTDCVANQFPTNLVDGYEETQAEDCLSLNVTMPVTASSASSLPVLVFLHGGAYFIGSSTRPYYNPVHFCIQALNAGRPHIFVSFNYRLGTLGFLHSPEVDQKMPANNGVHDQLAAFDFIRRFVNGFGGNPDDITAMGQSAGGMSLSVHNLSGRQNVWKRSIQFSGSLVSIPVSPPADHQHTFVSQASKLGVSTDGKNSTDIAEDMLKLPLSAIRDTAYVGRLCTQSELLPYEKASMALTQQRAPTSIQSQLVSSTTYDGGISYNLMLQDKKRKYHAHTFIEIAMAVLKHPQELLNLYDIIEGDEDSVALMKICQFESDVGFFAASLAQAQGFPDKTYLLLFDLGNPFDGPLPAKHYATHTWDIVALLGAYEHKLDAEYKAVISRYREKIMSYAIVGEAPWPAWTEEKGEALVVDRDGVRVVTTDKYMGPGSRRGRLLALAEKEAGEDGCDVLWSDVCRRFLMRGD